MRKHAVTFNLTHIPDKLPIYKTKINDSSILLGFQLFHYLSRCPDSIKDRYHYENYIDVFTNGSPRTIFEAATSAQELKNIDARRKAGHEILQSLSKTLFDDGYRILVTVLKLDLENLILLKDGVLQTCLNKTEWQKLREHIKHLGNSIKINTT